MFLMKYAEKSLQIVKEYVARHHNGNVSAAAAFFGINVHTLRRWLLDERTPSVKEIGKALDLIGVRVQEPDEKLEEFSMVPKVQARAGAGSSLITSDEVEGLYAFRNDFLTRVGIQPLRSVMLDVMGESMEPLIRNRDTILVDQSAQELIDGKIFLVGFGDELLVKRVQRTPRGWLLRSENKDYADIIVEGPDLETFRIYGRVRWFGRVL